MLLMADIFVYTGEKDIYSWLRNGCGNEIIKNGTDKESGFLDWPSRVLTGNHADYF